MQNEKLVARRMLFKSLAVTAGAFSLTRLLAACASKQSSLPGGDDFGTGTPPSSAANPTDGDEYVSADAGAPPPVDTGDAPKVPNASWEARVKQLEALGPVYTAAAPGPWAGKERSHVPQVTVSGNKVTVLVQHVMGSNGLDAGTPAMDAAGAADAVADAAKPKDGGADAKAADAGDAGAAPPSTVIHYITTIFLKSDANVVVGLWEFASTDPAPPSVTFTLPAGVTAVTAFEYCTIHGLWAATSMPIN